jgi:hypothetical protein
MIHKHNATANYIVAVMRRRRRQLSVEVRRYRMKSRPPIRTEHESCPYVRTPVAPILNAEADNGMIAVRTPPRSHNLMLVVVESWVVGVPMMLVMFLCNSRARSDGKKRHREGG